MGGVSQKRRDEAIDAFQAGKLRGIACTIQAGGVGITLTKAHHAVFIDRTFVPGDNLQAEDRVCRIGQDRGVIISDIVCDHPIDRRVHELLRKKEKLIAATTGRLAEDRRPVVNYEALAQELERIAGMIGG
jgi:SNF2 family DNA or RNA helicase